MKITLTCHRDDLCWTAQVDGWESRPTFTKVGAWWRARWHMWTSPPKPIEGHAVMNGFTITDADTGEWLAGPPPIPDEPDTVG